MLGHGAGIGYTCHGPRMGPIDNFSLVTGSHTFDKVAHYLIYRPQKDERLSWLILSGRLRPTYISGHPSVAGREWDRESSGVKDRRSATVQRNQLW